METRTANKSNAVTGTTTSSYVEAVSVDTRGYGVQGKFLAIIKNTLGTGVAPMYYKIDGYPADAKSQSVAIKTETSIASNTAVTQTDVDKGYAAVVISVKTNGSTPATYAIDWTTY